MKNIANLILMHFNILFFIEIAAWWLGWNLICKIILSVRTNVSNIILRIKVEIAVDINILGSWYEKLYLPWSS